MNATRPARARLLALLLPASLVLECATVHRPRVVARATATPQPPPPPDRAAVVHLLERFAFGPTARDVERVEREGIGPWFEAQLAPSHAPDPAAAGAVAPYADALRRPEDLYAGFALRDDDRALDPTPAADALPASAAAAMAPGSSAADPSPAVEREREAASNRAGCRDATGSIDPVCIQRARAMDALQMRGQLQMAELVRHVASERQVEEVMVDFWTNHFNVFFEKGPDRWLTGDFVERVIRPHALGRFEDLLVAVAHHPAMLVYLDNWRSVAEREAVPGLPARGLNENYARELLELHTLGVDGGYTQRDVVDVARVFTGWSITPPDAGLFAFQFRAWTHDRGEKTVLGQRFAPGGGEDEGVALLHLLAHHPSTAHFLARKLCQRFVADDPPERLVAEVAAAYTASDGDIAAMLRAIVRSPEFNDPRDRGTKAKTPLEFLASAMRALGARADGTDRLARVLARLGQPLFMDPVPTGWPERADAWMNSGAVIDRMNVGLALAAGRLPGALVDLDAAGVAPATDATALAREVDDAVLFGAAGPRTRDAIARAVADVRAPRQARLLAVALALGSPEFQRQ